MKKNLAISLNNDVECQTEWVKHLSKLLNIINEVSKCLNIKIN